MRDFLERGGLVYPEPRRAAAFAIDLKLRLCLWRSVLRPYRVTWRWMRAPALVPKPLPPRTWPFCDAPLPCEGCGAGPLAPPPVTAIGGAPKATGVDGNEPTYCEYARQYSVWLPSCT